MTAAFVTNPDRLAAIIKNVRAKLCGNFSLCQLPHYSTDVPPCCILQREYVVYPPEGQRPPQNYEELLEKHRQAKKQ